MSFGFGNMIGSLLGGIMKTAIPTTKCLRFNPNFHELRKYLPNGSTPLNGFKTVSDITYDKLVN